MEVIYTGLHQTPEQIAATVIQEDAHAVGLSILSGAHMTLVPKIVEMLREQGADDVLVTVGGTIPADDIPELKRLGVAEVFTPGSPTDDIVEFLRGAAATAAAYIGFDRPLYFVPSCPCTQTWVLGRGSLEVAVTVARSRL